jgi:hypothetical protein
MRHLAQYEGKRARFKGTFSRYGHSPEGPTMLIVNIYDNKDQFLADHAWMRGEINLKPGDSIQFEATVAKYNKGFKKAKRDLAFGEVQWLDTCI